MEKIKEGYTRVSRIIGQWNHLAHIDPYVLQNKCRIGTEVHEIILGEIEGIFLPAEEDVQPYLKSWREWWEKADLWISENETRFYCDTLKITGKVDAITDDGYILDYKTSATPNKKMWALQAAFYHYLAKKNYRKVKDRVWFVHLKKDGKKARVYEIECTEKLWEVCLSAFETYTYFHG